MSRRAASKPRAPTPLPDAQRVEAVLGPNLCSAIRQIEHLYFVPRGRWVKSPRMRATFVGAALMIRCAQIRERECCTDTAALRIACMEFGIPLSTGKTWFYRTFHRVREEVSKCA